ncbi:MAG: sigma-54-dependent Fis family transcriptional regulator [Acidobacteria bacterium]|nr:sigma-54-dependent Fis family transcriptional regulator [Acidobacteriota bacterium]
MRKTPLPSHQRALVVEDDCELRANLTHILRELGLEVESAPDGSAGWRHIKNSVYDILLTDLRLPGMTGEELICQARDLYPDLIIMVVTGYADVGSAVQVMKLGATDYIQKPFMRDELILRLQKAVEERRLRWEARELKQYSSHGEMGDLIGESAAMKRVKEMVVSVASKRTTVLILGETGTGKELVARAIHDNSPRQDGPMVAINCGAIPSTLLEDEFFGHEKGSFTGAQALRVGRFEEANRGTAFMDEIGNMPADLQSKLLRVLQERECQRIGGSQTIRLDVRFIAATNVNLAQKVKSGEFREDLFYRLNVFPISLPPLRERKEDILLLAPHLIEKICNQEGIPTKQLSQEAIKRLLYYEWPGNVRQLENALEMAVILAGDHEYLSPEHFPGIGRISGSEFVPYIDIPDDGVDFNSLVSEFEKNLILGGLKRAEGKRSRAALLLNIKRTTLIEKLKKMQLSPV